jgi:hypothetical protein
MPRTARNPRHVPLASIRLDGGTQARERLNDDAVGEYAAFIEAGHAFPPVTIINDGHTMWLADGFHRVAAAAQAGQDRILANVIAGTMLDAILTAAGSNAEHGVRRTNADKQRAVAMVLSLPGYSERSDREIARLCAVTHPFVASCRRRNEDQEQGDQESGGDESGETDETSSSPMDEAREALTELRNAIRTAKQAAMDLAGTSHGAFLNRDAIASDLANAISAIEGAMPARECPVCRGSGCRTCRNVGWVSRLVNDHAIPTDLQD